MLDIRNIDKESAWRIRHEVMWPDRELAYVQLKDDDMGHRSYFSTALLDLTLPLFHQILGLQKSTRTTEIAGNNLV